jgi:hypothetical protein
VEAARVSVEATITGPLKKNDNDFYLEVRKFIIGSKTISATRTDASTGSATVRNAR